MSPLKALQGSVVAQTAEERDGRREEMDRSLHSPRPPQGAHRGYRCVSSPMIGTKRASLWGWTALLREQVSMIMGWMMIMTLAVWFEHFTA